METDVVKNTTENGKSNVVRNAVLAGGAAVAGAGSVLGAEAVLGHGIIPESKKEEVATEKNDTDQDPTTQSGDPVQATNPNTQHDNHNAQNGSQQNAGTNNEPQPQDSNTDSSQEVANTNNANGGNGGGTTHDEGDSVIDNVNPDDVAQEIVEGDFIDPTDNDAPDLAIASVGTIETLDGQVFTAAQIMGEDGDNLYVVDLNHDDVLDVVTTSDGSLVDVVDGTLTVDDVESIITQEDPNQGYLAATDDTSATLGLDGDIMDNITNLDA